MDRAVIEGFQRLLPLPGATTSLAGSMLTGKPRADILDAQESGKQGLAPPLGLRQHG